MPAVDANLHSVITVSNNQLFEVKKRKERKRYEDELSLCECAIESIGIYKCVLTNCRCANVLLKILVYMCACEISKRLSRCAKEIHSGIYNSREQTCELTRSNFIHTQNAHYGLSRRTNQSTFRNVQMNRAVHKYSQIMKKSFYCKTIRLFMLFSSF